MEDCKYQAYNGWCNWHKRYCGHVNSKQCPYKKPYKNPKTNKGKTYKYYLIEYSIGNGEGWFDSEFAQYTWVKALSASNARKQISQRHNYYADSDYSSTLSYFGKTWEFDNMDELREFYYNNIKKENN